MDDSQTQSVSDSLSNTEVERLAVLLFDHVEGQVQYADQKAQLLVAADGLLGVGVIAVNKGLGRVLFDNNAGLLVRLQSMAIMVALVCLLASIYFAMRAALPRISMPAMPASLFFFGNISRLDRAKFVDSFRRQSPAHAGEAILNQVYAKSFVAQQKFGRLRFSINLLLVALFCAALGQMMSLFI